MDDSGHFDEILHQKLRWPRKGDRLFTQSADWQANAYIEKHPHARMVRMMDGYKQGADLMVERAKDDRLARDALVYPIIFSYRQFIELSLKYLIAAYGGIVGVGENWKTHDLATLWRAFKSMLDRYGHDDPDAGDDFVAKIVAEMAKVDPRSSSYRYPVDNSGVPLAIAHHELDLATLADVMKGVEGYFSGCDGYLSHLHDAGP